MPYLLRCGIGTWVSSHVTLWWDMRSTLATLIVGLIFGGVNPGVKLIGEITVVGLGGGGVGIAVAAGCGGRCGSGRGCHHLALVIDILVWLIAIVASL